MSPQRHNTEKPIFHKDFILSTPPNRSFTSPYQKKNLDYSPQKTIIQYGDLWIITHIAYIDYNLKSPPTITLTI